MPFDIVISASSCVDAFRLERNIVRQSGKYMHLLFLKVYWKWLFILKTHTLRVPFFLPGVFFD